MAPIHLEGLLGEHAHYLEPRVRPRPSDRAAAEDETTIMQDADEEARGWRRAVNGNSAEDETTHMQDADEAAHCWRMDAREPPTEGRQTNVLCAGGGGYRPDDRGQSRPGPFRWSSLRLGALDRG